MRCLKTGDQVNQYLDYDWCSVLTHVDKIWVLSDERTGTWLYVASTLGGAVFNKTCDQTNQCLNYNWCNTLTHVHDVHFSFVWSWKTRHVTVASDKLPLAFWSWNIVSNAKKQAHSKCFPSNVLLKTPPVRRKCFFLKPREVKNASWLSKRQRKMHYNYRKHLMTCIFINDHELNFSNFFVYIKYNNSLQKFADCHYLKADTSREHK